MSDVSVAPLKIVIVGHVDHGKSTLIGRLLYDTNSLPAGKYEELQETCKRRGTDVLEWSFLLDSYQAERDQAITIDTTQIWFKSSKRPYVIIDAPGHREFLKNMISGAAQADAAILVVDAKDGIKEQTRRHAYLLKLLGLKQIAVVINKMDAVQNQENRFNDVSQEISDYLGSLGVKPDFILPISARHGHMIASHPPEFSWFSGKNLLETLDAFQPVQTLEALPLRFPIQDVYRFDEKRILVGRLESGNLSVSDVLFFSPTNESAKVTSIETWPEKNIAKLNARTGESIAITLDQPIFAERGHMASHERREHLPLLSNIFSSHIFWLSEKALSVGNTYKIRFGTQEALVTVQAIRRIINTQNLENAQGAQKVEKNDVAEVVFRAQHLLALDPHDRHARLGRVVIYDGLNIGGGGLISMDGFPDQRANAPKSQNIYEVDHLLSADARAKRNGHKGGIFWFTGLSGAGKSTLAMEVERRLFQMGYYTYVLDGDNVRHGLCADLGFSPQDRAENIRRVGEVAALMADSGLIVITAFISPYRADRRKARAAAPDSFSEIYVSADLSTCEQRDPKGLYKKARKGEIKEFTGIDSPYETPENPEMVIDTQSHDIETSVQQVINFIIARVDISEAKGLTVHRALS
jgi:bifunctional enzyme CysN/CysC